MLTPLTNDRLSRDQIEEITRRYFDKTKTREKVEDIAESFGIVRQWVPLIAHVVRTILGDDVDRTGGPEIGASSPIES